MSSRRIGNVSPICRTIAASLILASCDKSGFRRDSDSSFWGKISYALGSECKRVDYEEKRVSDLDLNELEILSSNYEYCVDKPEDFSIVKNAILAELARRGDPSANLTLAMSLRGSAKTANDKCAVKGLSIAHARFALSHGKPSAQWILDEWAGDPDCPTAMPWESRGAEGGAHTVSPPTASSEGPPDNARRKP